MYNISTSKRLTCAGSLVVGLVRTVSGTVWCLGEGGVGRKGRDTGKVQWWTGGLKIVLSTQNVGIKVEGPLVSVVYSRLFYWTR